MGLDLDAIRKKLAGLSSSNRPKKIKFEDGKQRVLRIIAFPDNDGQPFKERYVYSIGKEWNLLAPFQFGKEDPIKALTDKLRSREGKSDAQAAEDWTLAKVLLAKLKHHAIVVDRDDEGAGPQLWPFSQSVAKRLYEIMLDEDYGDITDLEQGFDLKIKRVKEDNGFRAYKIDPRPKQTPLSSDGELATKWLDNLPADIDGLYNEKTAEELDTILTSFLNGDEESDGSSGSDGTERGGSAKSTSSGSSTSGDDAVSGQTFEDLDSAFDDLMTDDA